MVVSQNVLRQVQDSIHNKAIYGSYVWPSHNKIRILNETCYPLKDSIKVTSSGASVDVQELFDHTSERIFTSIDDNKKKSLKGKYLTLRCKAGMDGSSNQRQFQQIANNKNKSNSIQEKSPMRVFHEPNADDNHMYVDECLSESDEDDVESEDDLSDVENEGRIENNCRANEYSANNQKNVIDFSSVLMVSCVPLHLFLSETANLWKNPDPSSIRFCRPLMFEFMKENLENIKKTFDFYSESFSNLGSKKIPVVDGFVTIKYAVDFTMIDGKTCNAISGQKASCNICNATPTEMNDLDKIDKKKAGKKILQIRNVNIALQNTIHRSNIKHCLSLTFSKKSMFKRTR